MCIVTVLAVSKYKIPMQILIIWLRGGCCGSGWGFWMKFPCQDRKQLRCLNMVSNDQNVIFGIQLMRRHALGVKNNNCK